MATDVARRMPNHIDQQGHVWGRGVTWQQEATCWCDPHVRGPVYLPKIQPMIFHRPDPGMLFWDFGEQGPQPLIADG